MPAELFLPAGGVAPAIVKLRFKCHACDFSGDILDLARLTSKLPDFDAAERHVADFLGINLAQRTPLEGMQQPLFNLAALSDSPEPVFLTEAPLDVISIEQAGGRAIALGGTSTTVLSKVLGIYKPGNVFILAFDADGPGDRLQDKVGLMLEEREPHCNESQHRHRVGDDVRQNPTIS